MGVQVWNQKQEKTVRDWVYPALLGAHRETVISIFFYSHSPEGPCAPVPELHKNVSCREARDLLGPLGPLHHVRLSLICVCVQFGFVFFIWQVEEAFM